MDARLSLMRRDTFGKKAKVLVEQGNALANIYGKGEDSIAAMGPSLQVERVVNEAGRNHPIEITLDDGKQVLALVDEVERDAVNRHIHHVSFRIVIKGEKVSTEVPVQLTDEAPATKRGMIVVTLLDVVEVEAIPSKLPEVLEVSIAGLEEDGDQVSVADLSVPADVELKTDETQVVAKIETPRAQIEEEEEEAEDGEGEEGGEADVPSEHGGDSNEGESDQTDSKE